MKSIDESMTPPAKKPQAVNAQTELLAELTLKVDKILKFQKTARRIAIFRGVVSFIFLMVFIVLPIIASLYLVDWIKVNYDLESLQQFPQQLQQMQNQLQNLQETGSQLNMDALLQKLQR